MIDGPLGYNKVAALEDFGHPELRPVIRDVFPHEVARFGKAFPRGREHRKYWEIAMAIRAFSDFGVLRPDAEILGIGAGKEATLFWLTKRVRRVFATDLYLGVEGSKRDADTSMLIDPDLHSPLQWNRERLVVQHMDGRDLRYERDSFDGVFCTSAIEHFGTPADVKRSAEEAYRVLKPGGIFAVSTEFRLAGPGPGLPNILMFDEEELDEWIVGQCDWALVSPLETETTSATWKAQVSLSEATADLVAQRPEWSRYPHIVLYEGARVFTSVFLALRKGTKTRGSPRGNDGRRRTLRDGDV
jgi:SAM-dependent methyltransferase